MKQIQKNESSRRFKRTPQRLAILEYLEGNKSHPSAEDIYRVVSKKHQSMSFATVYNTLHTLTQAGSLRELTIDPERRRYDPDTSGHHHFICVLCDAIIDVPGEIGVGLPKEMAEQFTLLGNNVQFYGYCPGCEKKNKT
ncbi:MAG TPA: transcriptional repressor [Nitrospirota bacterium]|nr:transcriptional repressor [Nitrospirota bacterium]